MQNFDLKMDAEKKDIVSRAAALDRESRITMTAQDFHAFTTALDAAFIPNAALQNAMNAAREVKRA